MHHRTRRRIAGGIILGALTCALAAAPAAHGAGGRYTHVLCADPDTGRGVVPSDGRFPDGMTLSADLGPMTTLEAYAACAGGMTGGRGVLLSTIASFSTNRPDAGALIAYRAPADLAFLGATLFRSISLAPSNWATAVHRSASPWLFASPRTELCEWIQGCASRGSSDPFSAGNAVSVGAAGEVNGFNLALKCNIPDSSWSCGANGQQSLRLYGARVTLEDGGNPSPTGAPTGSLVEDGALRGHEDLTLNASDGGAGVYRMRLVLDGQTRLARVVDANNGRCADVNPANGDDYEFAYARPCKSNAGATFEVDTRSLPEGVANLRVVVEDAAGNATTALSRSITVDNVPPPTPLEPPRVTGAAREGSALAAEPGRWDDHGAASPTSIARRWQRCAADGSACVDIGGADGITYAVGSDDLGRRLRAVETASNAEGSNQSASPLTAMVTRADGTLPPDRDGVDNDGDGQVDEPGETVPGGGTTTGGTTTGGTTAGGTTGGGTGGTTTGGGQRVPSGAGGIASGSASSLTGANGHGASPRARLTAAFDRGGASRTVAYGRRFAVVGHLVDEHGAPIPQAVVEVTERVAVRGAPARAAQPVLTGSDGSFRYQTAARAGTRTLRLSYRAQRDGEVVSAADLTLRVRAAVQLRVRLRGTAVRYRGRVLSGPMPRRGKLVIVQGRAAGGRWQTFASRRARSGGRFAGRYRLKIRRPGARLQFRARAVSESGWPYLTGTSRAVTKRVR